MARTGADAGHGDAPTLANVELAREVEPILRRRLPQMPSDDPSRPGWEQLYGYVLAVASSSPFASRPTPRAARSRRSAAT